VLTRLSTFLGATLGGAIGWWAGERVGFMTSFLLSIVGTGVDLHAGRRFGHSYEV
jgi:uncharacterized membrane protein YbhN (UPF0104 family)